MNGNNLKKAGSWYLAGTFLSKGLSFLTAYLFIRLVSASDYGYYSTYISWAWIFSAVMGLSIDAGIRSAFVDYRENIRDFFSVCTSFTLLFGASVSLLVTLVILIFRVSIPLLAVVCCLLHGLALALQLTSSMYLQMRYQYRLRTLLMVLPTGLSMLLSLLCLRVFNLPRSYLTIVCSYSFMHCFVSLWCVLGAYKNSRCFLKREYLSYALAISAPMVLHEIAYHLLNASDRIMITALADASQTGIYSLSYNFSVIGNGVSAALFGIWVPWFTAKMTEGDKESINTASRDFIHLMTYFSVGLTLVSPEMLRWISTEEYWEGSVIIPPVIFSCFLSFALTLYVNLEHYQKKTVYITVNTIIAAVSNIILNAFLIPRFGYVAAAYTTLFSYLLSFLLHVQYAHRMEKDLFPLSSFFRPFVHFAACIVFFYLFPDAALLRWSAAFLYVGIMGFRERKRIQFYFPFLSRQ